MFFRLIMAIVDLLSLSQIHLTECKLVNTIKFIELNLIGAIP
jgi:hypothetical protein